jgi:hypothetical protein
MLMGADTLGLFLSSGGGDVGTLLGEASVTITRDTYPGALQKPAATPVGIAPWY